MCDSKLILFLNLIVSLKLRTNPKNMPKLLRLKYINCDCTNVFFRLKATRNSIFNIQKSFTLVSEETKKFPFNNFIFLLVVGLLVTVESAKKQIENNFFLCGRKLRKLMND